MPSSRWTDCRLALLLSAGVELIYLAFSAPGMQSVDNNMMLEVAISLVKYHNFSVPALWQPAGAIVGRGGLFYAPFYPLLSVIAAFFVAPGLFLANMVRMPDHYVAAIMALPVSTLCTAFSCGFVFLLARRLNADRTAAFLAALCYAFGTMAMVYTRYFYADPLLGLITIAALYTAFGLRPRDAIYTAVLASLAILAKPSGIVVGPVLAVFYLSGKMHRAAVLTLLGTIAGVALYAFFNWYRFGHASSVGQPWDFSLRFLPEALPGLLVSPGRGLLWFCPPLCAALILGFMALTHERWRQPAAILTVAAGFIVLHSCWSLWHATWSWGPRLILPIIPALCALLGLVKTMRMRRVIYGLAILGFFINAPWMIGFYERYYAEYFDSHPSGWTAINWSPTDTPLVHAWPSMIHEVHDASTTNVRDLLHSAGEPNQSLSAGKWLHVVALWWWMLPIVHIPRIVGVFIALLLIGSGLRLIFYVARLIAENPSDVSTLVI